MASKAIGFLNFKFGADLSGFERAMNKAQKKLKRFGKSVQKTGKSLSMGLTLPIVALGVASVKAFDEQQKAIAQVEAGLKSTAGTVGFTSKELQKMSSDLQKKTIFGDEEILKNATAQLLTFTNITGTEFAKTQEVVLDLATRLDGDLKSSAIMLGKALNDPVANLSALSRAGIQFSKEQKETINALVETNDLAGAQTIILAELEKQYGGSAEAAAAAGLGGIQQLQNEIGDLSEEIGKRLIPYVQTFATWIKGLAEKFDSLSDSTKDSIVFWGLILAVIGPVLIIIGKMSIGISALIPVFAKLTAVMMANPYLALAAGLILVSVAIYKVVTALNSQFNAQKLVNDIDKQAASLIVDQITSVTKLTSVIDSETTSLDEKKKALKTLKELYPGYYAEIDETTFSSDTLKVSTDKLKGALMDMARLSVYGDKIKETIAAQLDLEISMKGVTDGSEGLLDKQSLLTDMIKGTLSVMTLGADVIAPKFGKAVSEKMDLAEYERLNKQLAFLIDGEAELTEKTKDYSKTIKRVNHDVVDLTDDFVDLDDGLDDVTDGIDKLGKTDFELFGAPKIDSWKNFYTKVSNLQKQNLLDGVITQEEFDKKAYEEKIAHLEGIKKIHEEYGESTLKIDEEILDAKLTGYNKEEKAIEKVKSKSQLLLETIKERIQKLFGEDMDLGDLGKNLQAMLDGALQIFDAFNKKMRIKAENEKKIKTDALDEEYERQKAAIENSVMSEEQKAKMMEDLDKKTQAARTVLEEETEKKLAKIKKREAMRNKAMAIVDAIINTATAVTKVLGQAGLFGIPMAAIVGAMGAIQIGIIASTPLPLAEGGIVSGPTQALIGEYPGAGSNPEVVAPLDKLKSMIGGGNQHITVTGKLIGNDIFLSNAITGVNRQRTT